MNYLAASMGITGNKHKIAIIKEHDHYHNNRYSNKRKKAGKCCGSINHTLQHAPNRAETAARLCDVE
eukprot:scaffold32326_cov142-Skeletonema_marinoi.AAC.2